MLFNIFIGTAGWSIPSQTKDFFPEGKSHLERYSQVFSGVELNSSFYHDHRGSTYAKWAMATDKDFRFSVKLHQRFSHDKEFKPSAKDLRMFISEIKNLENKFAVLLIQLPGSLHFTSKFSRLLTLIRKNFDGSIVIEPRSVTWSEKEAIALYRDFEVTKVQADPERCPSPLKLNFAGMDYYRLHGSPVIYRSSYAEDFLKNIRKKLTKKSWCIFDNTTLGHGTENALSIIRNRGE